MLRLPRLVLALSLPLPGEEVRLSVRVNKAATFGLAGAGSAESSRRGDPEEHARGRHRPPLELSTPLPRTETDALSQLPVLNPLPHPLPIPRDVTHTLPFQLSSRNNGRVAER